MNEPPLLRPRRGLSDSAVVSYAHSAAVVADPESRDRAVWKVKWTAPASGEVHFHLTANSAIGRDSPLGDLVHATEMTLAESR